MSREKYEIMPQDIHVSRRYLILKLVGFGVQQRQLSVGEVELISHGESLMTKFKATTGSKDLVLGVRGMTHFRYIHYR